MIVLLLVLFSATGLGLAVQTTPVQQQQDSYLTAYSELHKATNVKNDRDFSLSQQTSEFTSNGYAEGPVYRPEGSYPPSAPQYGPPKPEYGPPKPEYGPPKPEYGPPVQQYGPPKFEYGPPKPEYGPPKPEYGPPHIEYGPPKPVYGPPKPIYGPPPTGYGFPSVPHYGSLYEVPHAMLGILDKLKLKLDLFTIGKIILKLVIFKKVVALIAILCLLLFLPSLKHKETETSSSAEHTSDEEDVIMMRKMGNNGEEKINKMAALVLEAIEGFPKKVNGTNCDSLVCRSRKMWQYVDKKINNKKLMELYMKEAS